MLSTNNNIDFKTVAKNLKKELAKLDFVLSHGVTLNLLSRSLGYADYNTFKAIGGEGIMKNERIDNAFNQYFQKHKESHQYKQLWDTLYKYGLHHTEDLKEACEWTFQFPFQNLSNSISQWIEDVYIDGDVFQVNSLKQYKIWVYENFILRKIQPFLSYLVDFSVRDMCRNSDSDCEKRFADILFKDKNFFPAEVVNFLNLQEEELLRAFENAVIYDKQDFKLDKNSSDQLETLLFLYDEIEHNNGIYTLLHNSKKITDDELLTLKELQYKLVDKDNNIVMFYPLQNLQKTFDSWMITFNPLFEEYAVISEHDKFQAAAKVMLASFKD